MNEYDAWNIDPGTAEKAGKVFHMKHGMFASVPILCKDVGCPYIEVCTVDPIDRIPGSRCPMEAAAIVNRFKSWCIYFGIDISGPTLKDEELADISLIRDLVETEVQQMRAENRIAINADFMGKTISQIDNKCKPYYEYVVTPEAEYSMKLQERRHKILQLLNATRKDKANTLKKTDPTSKTVGLIEKIKNKLGNIDLDKAVEETLNNEGENNGE